MRRSFDGLAALVRDVMKADVLSGHLFVFRNKIGDRLKLLYWDRSGLCIWYKRLEKGTFRFPKIGDGPSVEIAFADLTLILEGIDLDSAVRRERFRLPNQG
jgi:transposase